MPNGDEYRDERGGQDEYQPTNIYGTSQSGMGDEQPLGGTTQYGLESLSMESFFTDTGQPLPLEQIVALIKKHKPDLNETVIRNRVKDFLPKLQKISKEKAGFIIKEKDIAGEERGLAMTKAEDVYGLGVSAAERERGGIEETYQLGARAAERGLETSLGQAQGQAAAMGARARGAGGMGGGMRGAIGGQATLAKGVESTYGGYADKQTALAGARGRGIGGVEDRLTQLGQERGYAETQYGVGGIGEQRADLAYDKAQFGLKEDVKEEFESDVGTWLANFKQGGRVPNKQTFLDVLSKIPDAGGS